MLRRRLGERGAPVRAYKFRSMRFSDGGMWPGEGANTVTRVGGFLRRTSLDEFPQFMSVISGELSLIGPRNDLQALGKRLAEAIPYYDARYLVKPVGATLLDRTIVEILSARDRVQSQDGPQ